MSSNVNVTYQEMRDAATRLTNGQSEMEQKLQELQAYVQNLVNSGYVTDASSKAFDASYSEFTHGARQTVAGLEGMAQFLNQAAQTFEQADTTLASQIGR
jgi:WXG100 family type VII secretion target